MKKKGLFVVLICLAIACSVVLSSCSLVTVNEERQAGRVLADVNVDLASFGDDVKTALGNEWNYNVDLSITRRELVSAVNYIINYYSQLYAQYGYKYSYDVETLLDSSLESLINQKYQTAYAMQELLKNAKATGRDKSMYCLTDEYQKIYGKTLVPEGVLTVAERYAAIEEINEQFESQLKTYIEASEKSESDKEKSDATTAISELYSQGYLVDSVEVGYKTEEEGKVVYKTGLYTADAIDDNDSNTSDLDATKIYARVNLKKGDEIKTVDIPVAEEDVTEAEKEDAEFVGKYVTVKTVTVSYVGRVYAEKTEDNDTGYEIKTVTSEPVDYELVKPRSYPTTSEEEHSHDVGDLRYVSVDAWKGELTAEMKELVAEIFKPTLKSYSSDAEKDAYRQLRSTFKSSNIGFVENDPGEDSENYINYTYYNGLEYYYKTQFENAILTAVEYEITESVTVTPDAINAEYEVLLAKDKAKYDGLSYEEQVTKFFEAIKTDLSSVYYLPVDALTSTKFEIKPTDKAYKALFTLDESGAVTAYNTTYVTEDNGKYYTTYAYKNEDGTVTVNMVYTAHILTSFSNMEGFDDSGDKVKNLTLDLSDEKKMEIYKQLIELVSANPQKDDYVSSYDEDKTYHKDDVFGESKTMAEIREDIETALKAAYDEGDYETFYKAFTKYMVIYNDDSGAIKNSGYLVSAGEMNNGWAEDFTATCLSIYYNLLVKGNGISASQNDGVDFADLTDKAYSLYGEHLMYVCFAPLYKVSVGENGGIGTNFALNKAGDTHEKTLNDSLLKTAKSDKFSAWKKEIKDEAIKNATTRNEKNYKIVVKDLKD